MWKETSNFLRASGQGPLQYKKEVIREGGSNKQGHTATDQQWGDSKENKTWSIRLIDNRM